MDGGATLLRLFVTKKKDAYIGRKDFELVDDHVVKMDDHDSVASSSPLRAGGTLIEHRCQIEAAVQFASTHDAMPHQLLSKIDYVISLAEKEHIPTTKFSVLLRLLNKAIQYGCSVSQDRFSSLHETSMTALDNCDTAFERFLRVSTEEGQAKAELETCEQFAEEAATEARRDCEKLKERAKDDDSMATLDELEQTHTEANEMVASEKQALTEDRDQFSYDMKRIDKLLRDLVVAMDRSDVEYAEIMKELKTEIFSNRCHQERLREHLWRLEKEEGELKAEMAMPEAEESRARSELEEEMCSNHGSQEKLREELQRLEERLRVVEATARVEELLQDKGDEDYHCTVKDISQWREELDTLHQQAEMSLLIVDTMSECVQFVMENAKKKKRDRQKKLHDMKLKSLLQLRDSLMATASIYRIGVDICKTCEDAENQATSELESSTENQQLEHRGGHSQHGEKVKAIQAELLAIDGEIQGLDPHLHLDTLEDRYEKRRESVILVYKQNDNAAEVCSHDNYEEKQGHGSEDAEEITSRRKKKRTRREVGTNGSRRPRSSRTRQPSQSNPSHSDESLNQCQQCQRKFSCRSSLKRHMVIHSGEEPHQCEYCQRKFRFQTNLRTHILTHTKERPHQCDHCRRRFTQKWQLQSHILTHTGEKPHQCEYCQKRFANKAQLRLHILTHTGEKPHQCKHCQKRFTCHGNLRKHTLTHTMDKPHQCDHCQKRFRQNKHLQGHMVIHTGEKPYQCSHCQKRFSFSSNLNVHLRTHTGEKPHQCEYCQKRFSQSGALRQHILTHTKERPYQCDYCKLRFVQRVHLQKHVRRAHTGK